MRNLLFLSILWTVACVDSTDGDDLTETDDDIDGTDESDSTDVSTSTDESDSTDVSTSTDESDTTDESTDSTGDIEECGGAFADVVCDSSGCYGRWLGTEAWSRVVSQATVDSWTEVPAEGQFSCGSIPSEIDGCAEIDELGHVACWEWEGNCARIAIPLCVVAGIAEPTDYWPDWMLPTSPVRPFC
jgi:hypothetical protein